LKNRVGTGGKAVISEEVALVEGGSLDKVDPNSLVPLPDAPIRSHFPGFQLPKMRLAMQII